MNNNYTLPKHFDPHLAVYALKGLAETAYQYYTEGGGVYRTVPAGDYENLVGLSWLARRVANELVDYFAALDDADVKLPISDEEFGTTGGDMVKEPAAVYMAREYRAVTSC